MEISRRALVQFGLDWDQLDKIRMSKSPHGVIDIVLF